MIKELIIDVDGKFANYVAMHDKKIVRILSREINKDLTNYFVETIKWFLYASNSFANELNNIYFVNGPGSFTNIRLSTLLVRTISTLNKNISLQVIDRLHFYSDYSTNEFVYIQDSSNKKFIYIHKKDEEIVNSKLVNNDEFEELSKLYFDFEKKDITNYHIEPEISKNKIENFNLHIFKEVNDLDELSANYMKEPNVDKKVLK